MKRSCTDPCGAGAACLLGCVPDSAESITSLRAARKALEQRPAREALNPLVAQQ
jgi:hypothetical protein